MIPASLTIEEFYRGAWVADCVTVETPDGSFDVGGATWRGTVLPTGVTRDGSRYRARIVGGAGKLATVLPDKNYDASLNYGTVASDIISACGESPGTVESGGRVPRYQRARGTAGQALGELCDAAGLVWWVDRAGLVNVAAERPTVGPVPTDTAPQLSTDVDGSVSLNVEVATDVQPGMTLSTGAIVRHIRWKLSDSLHAECSPTQPFPDTSSTFYNKVYSAKVDRQNANGSVNLIVDARYYIGGVPLLSGLPGASLVVKPGESVSMGFLGGNKSAPYACCFAQTTEDAKALALVGDSVQIVMPPFTFTAMSAAGPISGVMTPMIPKALGQVVGPGSLRTKSQ